MVLGSNGLLYSLLDSPVCNKTSSGRLVIDKYQAAWKALRSNLLDKKEWTSKEIYERMLYFEVDYRLEGIGEMLDDSK